MSQPVKHYRLGDVHASVFLNEGEDGSFHTITMHRRYKDGNEWKTSDSFTGSQMANAIVVGQLAASYVVSQESNNDQTTKP